MKPKLIRKKVVAGVALSVLIIALGIAALNWRSFSENKTNDPIKVLSAEEVYNSALNRADNDDINGALLLYDEQIEARDDKDEKKSLLLQKASFARQAGRSKEAVAATTYAYEIAADAATAEELAKAYEASGDMERALQYYKKALELSPKEGMGARYNRMLEEKIMELEQ